MKRFLTRRDFLKFGGLSVTACLTDTLHSLGTHVIASEFDFVLHGGRVFQNGRWGTYDIGVTPAGKLVINPLPLMSRNIIDVTGKIVSPGFIDILADNSVNPERTYHVFEKYKLGDGVATALQMHGGATHAGEYYRYFENEKHFVNYGVSTKVMNLRNKYPDLNERLRAIEESLDEGGLGVSHSLEYQSNTTWEEALTYARIAKKYDRPYFLHTRYSCRDKELLGVDEAIRFAQKTGCRVHIDHLNSTGGTFHMEEALERIRNARRSGLDVTTCVYPCSYWATYIHSERFKGDWQGRYGMTYSDLEIVGTGERLTEDSFHSYRKQAGILVAARAGVQPMEKTVKPALMEDFCLIGSDGGIEKEPCANNHPRGANCFATAIRYAMDEQIPLEKILEKMTVRSAALIGPPMKNRGELREGYIADITVFDPDKIRGVATNANPCQFSSGIELVVVNGKIALKKNKLTGEKEGTAIKY